MFSMAMLEIFLPFKRLNWPDRLPNISEEARGTSNNVVYTSFYRHFKPKIVISRVKSLVHL